jgi:hypothetical protein
LTFIKVLRGVITTPVAVVCVVADPGGGVAKGFVPVGTFAAADPECT